MQSTGAAWSARMSEAKGTVEVRAEIIERELHTIEKVRE